jgi:hypothetical protein
VQWRLTFPQFDLSSFSESQPVHLIEMLHVKFELLFCELLAPSISEPNDDISKLIPSQPTFEIVSCQNIAIQQADSSLHQYYPVLHTSLHPPLAAVPYLITLACSVHRFISVVPIVLN